MQKIISFIFLLLFLLPVEAKDFDKETDSLFFENHLSDFKEYQSLPIGELMTKATSLFEGRPYVPSTLEKEDKEGLTVNLHEFDCTTLVENGLALTKTIKSKVLTFEHFKYMLQMIRYRDGIIDDYSSRLHYVTDWIYDNSKKGVIINISKDLEGILNAKKINFMTTHPDSYKQLKGDKEMLQKMQDVEADINERGGYYYIPKKSISKIENKIKEGDVIAFATSVCGLDYSHMGIACRDNGKLTFIHASTRSKKVIVEPSSLYEYCMKSSNCIGITVLRINE